MDPSSRERERKRGKKERGWRERQYYVCIHVISEQMKTQILILGLLTASGCLDFVEITSLIIRISASTSLMSFDLAKRPRETEK